MAEIITKDMSKLIPINDQSELIGKMLIYLGLIDGDTKSDYVGSLDILRDYFNDVERLKLPFNGSTLPDIVREIGSGYLMSDKTFEVNTKEELLSAVSTINSLPANWNGKTVTLKVLSTIEFNDGEIFLDSIVYGGIFVLCGHDDDIGPSDNKRGRLSGVRITISNKYSVTIRNICIESGDSLTQKEANYSLLNLYNITKCIIESNIFKINSSITDRLGRILYTSDVISLFMDNIDASTQDVNYVPFAFCLSTINIGSSFNLSYVANVNPYIFKFEKMCKCYIDKVVDVRNIYNMCDSDINNQYTLYTKNFTETKLLNDIHYTVTTKEESLNAVDIINHLPSDWNGFYVTILVDGLIDIGNNRINLNTRSMNGYLRIIGIHDGEITNNLCQVLNVSYKDDVLIKNIKITSNPCTTIPDPGPAFDGRINCVLYNVTNLKIEGSTFINKNDYHYGRALFITSVRLFKILSSHLETYNSVHSGWIPLRVDDSYGYIGSDITIVLHRNENNNSILMNGSADIITNYKFELLFGNGLIRSVGHYQN